jgi:hypothetical protein
VRINYDMLRTSTALAGLGRFSLMTLPTAEAAERWLLMSRHGECVEVGVLKRKVPDLGEVRDPGAFVSFMRQKGYEVTVTRVSVPRGKAQEVKVPQKELFLTFVTSEMCSGPGTR